MTNKIITIGNKINEIRQRGHQVEIIAEFARNLLEPCGINESQANDIVLLVTGNTVTNIALYAITALDAIRDGAEPKDKYQRAALAIIDRTWLENNADALYEAI